jgi:hypothetical protein
MDRPSAGEHAGRRAWLAVLTSAALAVTLLAGTIGWFATSFGIGTTCANDFSCGYDSCAPCAKAHAWVITAGIGQWMLAAVAVVILVLGRRRPSWRRALTVIACALIPLAVAWFAVSTAMAQRSF